MTKLSKEDWNQLDDLLAKHGFGGYYDLVECLKMVLSRMTAGHADSRMIKDLSTIVHLLMNTKIEVKKNG